MENANRLLKVNLIKTNANFEVMILKNSHGKTVKLNKVACQLVYPCIGTTGVWFVQQLLLEICEP